MSLCLPRPRMFHYHQLFSLEEPLQLRMLEKSCNDMKTAHQTITQLLHNILELLQSTQDVRRKDVSPFGNTGYLQLCRGQSCAGSSQQEQSLDQGRGVAGLRWTASLEVEEEEGIGLVFRLPAFGGVVATPDVVATCCCPCCCPCWGWSTAKGSSGQQTPGTKRDLKQMEPRNWTRSAKSRGQS